MKSLEIATSLQILGLILLNKVFQMWFYSVILIPKNVPIVKIVHWIQFHKDSKNLRTKMLKFEFSHILRVCSYLYELCITICFEHVNSYAKIFKILHLQGGNATTQLTLFHIGNNWSLHMFWSVKKWEDYHLHILITCQHI